MTQPYVGQIMMFGGNFAIQGWAFCNGRLMNISDNPTLFQLIGTTYGGDGVNTFALPNLQSRVAVHQGTGQGLSPYVLGQAAGTENVTLTVQQMPAHNHSLSGSGTTAGSGGQTPSASVLPGRPSSISSGYLYIAANGTSPPPSARTLTAGSCSTLPGSQPHSNIMPVLCVTYLIALYGIFPSQN
jgi:microcystin-dependent protein